MNSVLVLFEFYQKLEPLLKMGRLIVRWSDIYKFSQNMNKYLSGLGKDIVYSLEARHLSDYICLFAPKFWETGGDPQMILCQSVSAV